MKHKSSLLLLILSLLLWLVISGIVFFIDPDTLGIIPIFILLIFLASLFSFSLLLTNTRRGLLIAIGVVIFLTLGYFGLGNFLNLLLVSGVIITLEIYIAKKS